MHYASGCLRSIGRRLLYLAIQYTYLICFLPYSTGTVSRYSSREAAGKEKKSGKARKDIHVLLSFTRYKAKKKNPLLWYRRSVRKACWLGPGFNLKVRYFLPTFSSRRETWGNFFLVSACQSSPFERIPHTYLPEEASCTAFSRNAFPVCLVPA